MNIKHAQLIAKSDAQRSTSKRCTAKDPQLKCADGENTPKLSLLLQYLFYISFYTRTYMKTNMYIYIYTYILSYSYDLYGSYICIDQRSIQNIQQAASCRLRCRRDSATWIFCPAVAAGSCSSSSSSALPGTRHRGRGRFCWPKIG